MVNMGLLHRLRGIFIVLLTSNVSINAAQLASPRANHGQGIDPHLSSIMKANAQISRDSEIKETWAWLEQLSSKPACTQLASSKLATECQLLESPSDFAKSYPYQILEDVQNEYALKLAICEYAGVQSAYPKTPNKCHAFLPTREACVKRSWWDRTEATTDELCYPKATKGDLSQCLSTMQASPQTWTSYSNARSRAMHICHLTRQHIEMQRAIQVHKNLTLVVAKMHDSVQPLESKIQSMNDQLHMFSDDFRRSFEESQQAAQEFTIFAKDVQKAHQDQLEETNRGLRHVQSELEASQHHINEHYSTLHAKLDDYFESSLAKNKEVIAQHQDDFLAEFARAIDSLYQARALELSAQFKTHSEELQEYHTKNMLALQQHHKTSVQSLEIIKMGLDSANSDVESLNDKIGTLRIDLDDSIARVEIVNEGLGSLASVAQTAGRFLAGFETFVTYFGAGAALIGLVLFIKCVSRVPVVGNAAHNLTMMTLTALVCVISSYTVSRSISIPFKWNTFVGALSGVEMPEWSFFHIKISMSIFVLACTCLVIYEHFFYGKRGLFAIFSYQNGLPCMRTAPQTQSYPTTQLLSMGKLPLATRPSTIASPPFADTTIRSSTPDKLAGTACIGKLSFSKEAHEDEGLRDRILHFQRASTVC